MDYTLKVCRKSLQLFMKYEHQINQLTNCHNKTHLEGEDGQQASIGVMMMMGCCVLCSYKTHLEGEDGQQASIGALLMMGCCVLCSYKTHLTAAVCCVFADKKRVSV